MNVTQKAIDYLMPLIQGESHPPFKNGIPLLKEFKLKNEWMLAGGINVLNIQEAVITTNAPIVDVSSALEDDLGIKSPKKIEEFLNLAKSNKV